MMTAPTATQMTVVSMRLPNSIAPCRPVAAVADVNESSVQRGHVGQPSPEPVTRTMPPVTMMRTATATAIVVVQRTAREWVVGAGLTARAQAGWAPRATIGTGRRMRRICRARVTP